MRALSSPTAKVPEGESIYAVGEIHRRLDLLELMQAAILSDARQAARADLPVVNLGDYANRGRWWFELVDEPATHPLPGPSIVHLRAKIMMT